MSKNLSRVGYYCLISLRSSVSPRSPSIVRRKFCTFRANSSKSMSSPLTDYCSSASTDKPVISIDTVKHWKELCDKLNFSASVAENVWQVLETRYGEEQRHYHNIHHIRALLRHSVKYADRISDKEAVDLAIYFHDVVYDPKSKTNEEDSADLFVNLCSPHINSTLCEKVRQYIIETKKHDVSLSDDNDLKLFIDMDMSILGVHPTQYAIYSQQIRQEYEFVPEADYCRGRAAVLESFLQPSTIEIAQPQTISSTESVPAQGNKKYIFATELCRSLWEEQARRNLAWECEILNSGRLV